MKEDNVT